MHQIKAQIAATIVVLLMTPCIQGMTYASLDDTTNTMTIANAAVPVVYISPPTVICNISQSFDISIKIANVTDLYSWEFRLHWNITLLNAINIVEGSFLRTGGSTYFYYVLNATAGYMIVDCTLLSNIPGVTGSGTLATMTFYVKNAGECPLDLSDVILLNSLEQQIQCQIVDGYGRFTSSHDVAITNVNASPTAVLPGTVVNINVTAEDQGAYAESFNVTVYANSQVVATQHVNLNSGSSTTILFNWNTAGLPKGDYTIVATASIVPNEVDTDDNTRVSANVVTILTNGHDVAAKKVTPSKTIVAGGYSLNITVTAKNYGIFTENFNVTAYANSTAIQKQTVTLTTGATKTLIFIWNTAGLAEYQNYTISAHASAVPGETDLTDNTCTDGKVEIAHSGDVNGDGKVDIQDVARVSAAFGTIRITDPQDPRYGQYWHSTPCPRCPHTPNADINNDGRIDIQDLARTVRYFGWHK